MVRVLNIISDTNIGGAGNVLLNYLKYHDRNNFEISVVVPRGSHLKLPLERGGTAVYEIDGISDKSFDFKAIKKLKKIIKQVAPDVVHTHGALSGRIAAGRCHVPIVYTRHSVFDIDPKRTKGIRLKLNKKINEHYADRIIAVSPAAKKNLTDVGISESYIDVVMNGIAPMRRYTPTERAEIRTSFGIGDDDFALGIVARIEEYKGHGILLDALTQLLDRGLNLKLLIAGTGSNEEALRVKIAEIGAKNNINFLGFVKDVESLLNALDLQINASNGTEATSLSLLEGMSIGLPAVVSDFGGNPFLIEHEKNGLVFKCNDSRELAHCIERMMFEKKLYDKISKTCIETFHNKYTGKIFASNTEKVYLKTLEGKQDGK